MIKVKLKSNKRVLDIDEISFSIKVGEIKELQEKDLRLYELKDYLWNGILEVVEGEVRFLVKDAPIWISAKYPNKGFTTILGQFCYRDLSFGTFSFYEHTKEEIPKDVIDGVLGKVEVPKQEPQKLTELVPPKIEPIKVVLPIKVITKVTKDGKKIK